MRSSLRSAAVVSSFAVSAAAFAQNAVQWRVEDGGNGHWYSVTSESLVYPALRAACASHGGHLVTLTSQAEWQWVKSNLPVSGFFVGGYQDRSSAAYAEPNGGWKWVTGEPFALDVAYMGTTHIFCTMSEPGFDDCPAGTCDYCGCGTPGAQDALFFTGCCNNILDDIGDGIAQNCDSRARNGIIEWSADCNGNGVVDFGEIRAGIAQDANGNNIPDSCEPGFVVAWGSNDYGETTVPPSLGPVKAIDAGSFHSAALKTDGTVACWGAGTSVGAYPHFGQSMVPAGLTNVVDVAAAGMHTLALRADGSLACWGADDYGQSTVPADVGTVARIAAGFAHTVALRPDGSVRCWGRNNWGECSVPAALGAVIAVAAGDSHTIVLESGGSIVAWGNNSYGQTATPAGLPPMVEVRSKGNHNIARTAIGEVFCWNLNAVGQCTVPPQLGSSLFVSSGGEHSLALKTDGSITCWGSNSNGQCAVPSLAAQAFRVVGGDRHTLAIVNLADSDADGRPDLSDNCPQIANPGQADCDADGIGDACEIASGAADTDSNGIPDICEFITVPTDFATVQAAIDSVAAGTHREIRLLPGTYSQSFSLNGKDILIRGAADGTTILDGTGLPASIATFTGGEPATAGLENLVFRNGAVGSLIYKGALFRVGGAVYGTNSSAFIRNCRFENNRSDYGGGAYLLYCNMLVEDCVFTGNTGISHGGGLMVFGTTGTVRGCAFTGNQSGIAGPGGGSAFKAAGTLLTGETVLFENCTVTGNTAGVEGGAVEFYENVELNPGVMRLVNSTITGNRSGTGVLAGAGGLVVTGRMQSVVVGPGTTICDNLPREVDGPYFIEGAPTICDCQADLSGDGIVNGGDLGLLLSAWGPTQPNGAGDVNHDGQVDGADLGAMLGSWGICP